LSEKLCGNKTNEAPLAFLFFSLSFDFTVWRSVGGSIEEMNMYFPSYEASSLQHKLEAATSSQRHREKRCRHDMNELWKAPSSALLFFQFINELCPSEVFISLFSSFPVCMYTHTLLALMRRGWPQIHPYLPA
jgi:hypothetical protein